MNDHVLRLEEVGGQGDVAGGKAANLGVLAAEGFPVPPGFVVSAEACRDFFDAIGLDDAARGLGEATGDELAQQCSALHRRIVAAEMRPGLAQAILAAHARLFAGRGDVSCAVRSSATAEDLAAASFAGQHHTYYYVNAAHLLEMIRHCWASLWSPEAVSYRSTHGISSASVFMAVVVQEMVPAEVSGVTFTANPMSGDRGEIVIESSWGMGAAIVDGRVTPDRYIVGRNGLELRERRVADKRFMVPSRLAEGRKERMVNVPHALRRRESLAADQVGTVASWALRCEERFGGPQDVEWAIAGGRFHLLQSRPITTLKQPDPGGEVKGKYVLFKPLAENFTEPLTPLTVEMLAGALPPIMGRVIRGRFYLNLAGVRPMIPFRMSDEDLAGVLFLSGEAAPASARFSLLKLPVAIATVGLLYLALGVLLARTRGLPDDVMRGYRALCRRVEEDPRLDPVDALRRLLLLPGILEPIGHMVMPVNLASLRFAPWMSLLRAMLHRWVPARAEAVTALCSGSEGVLSAQMGREIFALAQEAKRTAPVAELLARHQPEEALARLREEPSAGEFLARLDAFLAVHGHRAIKEFELRSARWDESPATVVAMIRNHLASEADPTRAQEKAARARADMEAEIRGSLEALPLERLLRIRWRLVRLAAGRARYYFKLRENSRFYHIMGFGVVRKKILAIEAELLRQGTLKCKDDVFFLRWHELFALRDGRWGWRDVEERIRQRRVEYVRLSKITPPRTIGIETTRESAAPAPAGGEGLHGQPASPGSCEGLARVILDPSVDAALKPGEVLVAPYTDPAWTPLFLTAGAAVVEVGSYLSHAGTVAREYGMPCVVDVPDCTRRIQTGARIHVDGDRGLVKILAPGGAE